MSSHFLTRDRLIYGPWQAFERDVARLMLHRGFEDVRVVGGTGDRGADVLATRGAQVWVVQCKFTSSSSAPKTAIDEVLQAARFYGADVAALALSRAPSRSLQEAVNLRVRNGANIKLMAPAHLTKAADKLSEFPPSRRSLRPYQEEAARSAEESIEQTGKAQLVLATGLGKTVIMAEVTSRLLQHSTVPDGRVLVLAHTRDLVEQLHFAFWHQLPRWIETHHWAGGESPQSRSGVTFATVDTASGQVRPREFGMIVIDEAHHAGSPTYQALLGRIQPEITVGATATPWRGDGFDIDQVFGTPTYEMGIADGLAKGYLSEVDYRLLGDNIDWEMVRELSQFSYSARHVNRKLIIPQRDEEAARTIARTFRQEQRSNGIVYSPSAEHAREFSAHLQSVGITARVLLGELDDRVRYATLAAFKAGRIEIITTVDLLNEGVDVPDVDMVVFMRGTHSRRIFVQQLGRGLRISAGKDKVIVLDFVSDLTRVADVLRLDTAASGGNVERLGLGPSLVQFTDQTAGTFLQEWLLDQVSLSQRPGDPSLERPDHEYI